MLYKDDWENTKQRFKEYWAHENHDRPLININAPKDDYKKKVIPAPDTLEERWMDVEYVIKRERDRMASTFFGAESFPMLWPNLGPDIFGATLGCDIIFEETTSYAKPIIDDWNDANLTFDPQNKWWKKIVQMTEAIVNDAKGDYFVGITDLHIGADGLVSLRGPERLCMDLYDYPEVVKKAVFDLLPAFKYQLDTLYDITTKNLPGCSNWLGVWHPEKWYVTSSDFIGMISEKMFEEFVLPELLEEFAWLDQKTIFHLDGPGALKHLDRLLEIPDLAGVQWVYGAGQPTAAHWIPELKKIQNAGKLVHIDVVPQDIDVLLEELRPEGVMFYMNNICKSELEAKSIIKKLENSYKKKLY